MAFEVIPLEPDTVTRPAVIPAAEPYRITLAGKLFQAGHISIDEAAEIAGIAPTELEAIFMKRGMITRNKIMVCGGAGFIGSNFVHYILEKYPYDDVVVYDKLTYAGNLENLRNAERSHRYSFYQGDIADAEYLDEVIRKEHPDFIVNFAAETHVTRSLMFRADEFLRTNVIGTHTLLEAVRTNEHIKRLVHVSTDEVYGTLELGEDRKFFETDPFEPNVPYSAAKAGGDLLARAYRHSYGARVIVTHCTNNYGPFQHPEKLIPNALFRALRNKPITIHGNGQHVRDWIYVRDHCEALDLIMRKGKDGDVYNVAANVEKSTSEIARTVLRMLGKPEDLMTAVDDRPGNDLRYSLHINKIKDELGWEPRTSFEEGIARTIQWYQNNIGWVEAIRERDKEFSKYI